SSGSLPTLDEVMDRYLKATGGAAVLNGITSRMVKGTVDVVGVSRGGTFEIYSVVPNKVLSILKVTPAETFKVGYNGRVGWTQTSTGARMMKGAELESLQKDADFYLILNLKNAFPNMTM